MLFNYLLYDGLPRLSAHVLCHFTIMGTVRHLFAGQHVPTSNPTAVIHINMLSLSPLMTSAAISLGFPAAFFFSN